ARAGVPRAWGGRRRLVQPRRAPSPASRPSPTDPALRANPYPEVTDPACRLPLPTLFQHARGCSPWRPAADVGTGPSLGANPFQGALPFTKKRELSPGLPLASPGSVALSHWTPCSAHLCHSGFGDLNPTPFQLAEGNGGHRPSLQNSARP
uniref:Uncharacterized protein n=1 Tax=Ursus maritimus TaxID=29073 RepID=A0A452SZZ5_URSMA